MNFEKFLIAARNDIANAAATSTCCNCKCEVRLKEFRDELSLKEYSISRLCQECQDEVFADDDED